MTATQMAISTAKIKSVVAFMRSVLMGLAPRQVAIGTAKHRVDRIAQRGQDGDGCQGEEDQKKAIFY